MLLRLAASLTIGNHLPPPIVAHWHAEHPAAQVQLRIGNTRDVADAMLRFDADIGFVEGSVQQEELQLRTWMRDQMVICGRPDHLLARKRASAAALAAARIVREPGSGTRATVDQGLLRHLGWPAPAMVLGSSEAVRLAEAAGAGISCLSRHSIADALAAGTLIALRSRLGLRSSAHTLAKLIDPFSAQGGGVRMVSVTHPADADKMTEFFVDQGKSGGSAALLMRGTEGEAFANPKRRPQIEYFSDGRGTVLFEAEHGSLKTLPNLPDDCDARTTAQWIRETLDGAHPIPPPLINQLACCLFACGYSRDFTEAKAIAAVKARLPLAA